MAGTTSTNRTATSAVEAHSGIDPEALSIGIAAGGLKTTEQVSKLMSALVNDLLHGRVPPKIANPVNISVGKSLKALEMRHRFAAGKDLKLY